MTRLTFAAGIVAGAALATAAVMLVPFTLDDRDLSSPGPGSGPVERCAGIECQFLPSDHALRLQRRLERQGYTCTGKARLSESVIVDLAAGARVLPFDRALHIGDRGSGWMRSYCSQP